MASIATESQRCPRNNHASFTAGEMRRPGPVTDELTLTTQLSTTPLRSLVVPRVGVTKPWDPES